MPNEVIVVDNNSRDATVAIAKSFSFVRVVKEKKQGIVYARNCGFNAAKGDVIARIDADTRLPRHWVRDIQRFYADPNNMDVAVTGRAVFDNVRMSQLGSWLQEIIAFRFNHFLLGHHILYGANMALPSVVWRLIRNDVCLRTDIHEDIDLSIHLHEGGFTVVYDDAMRVGATVRRVHSNRSALWRYLKLWPETLRAHANNQWYLAWLGAAFLYAGVPVVILNERIARFMGEDPLSD